jgi:hypothetical protein
VNVPLLIAGCLALLGTLLHGVGGELLVVRKLSPETLPGSRFGGPRMTLTMIHVSWHIVTVAFLSVGCALLLAATALDDDAARAVGVLCAAAVTGFAAVAVVIGVAYARSARPLVVHPGPAVLTATAVLAWCGAL